MRGAHRAALVTEYCSVLCRKICNTACAIAQKKVRQTCLASHTFVRKISAVLRSCSAQLSCALTLSEIARCEFPVDQAPEGLDVFGARVAIVDVVGMFPHVA